MNIRRFNNIPCIECLSSLVNPKLGDLFLTGTKMIAQKEIKDVGQEVSWYEVTSVHNYGNFSYSPRYSRLTNKMEDV